MLKNRKERKKERKKEKEERKKERKKEMNEKKTSVTLHLIISSETSATLSVIK